MLDRRIADSFIGHVQELEIFERWFANTDASAPWMLFFHDALNEPEKKGGVGKTWLLRKCAALIKQLHKDVAVAVIDCFSIADRDGVVVAQRVVESLQETNPQWSPELFLKVQSEYGTVSEQRDGDYTFRLYEALSHDMSVLEEKLKDAGKHLLIFFDTFELIEEYPLIAVLGLSFPRTFPDRYGFKHLGVVIAGRNAPDWTRQNWKGREREVQVVPVQPFNMHEMVRFVHDNSTIAMGLEVASPQALALYERTQGRPILIGLVTDVLNRRILTLDQLLQTSVTAFESYLVVQINSLEQPINWIVLFMAHVYHRFSLTLLQWLFSHSLDVLSTLVQDIQPDQLASQLLDLSFVRRSDRGDNLALHDEMRRLVNMYNWSAQELQNGFYRRELSIGAVSYYQHELDNIKSERLQQVYTVEMVYHKLFVDIDEGFAFFQQRFRRAINLWQSAFARLLFQEAQKFKESFSQDQYYTMLLNEASLLWREENDRAAIMCYDFLEARADKQWLDDHYSTILYEKGSCYQQISAFPESIACFTKSLSFMTEERDPTRVASLHGKLGYVYQRQGDLEKANGYYVNSIRLYKSQNNMRGYADILNSQGGLYRLQGKLEEALRRCTAAWRIRKALYEQRKGNATEIGVAISLNSIGLIYLRLGDLVSAQRFFQDAFVIYERNNHRTGIASIYMRFGQVAMEKNEIAIASRWFNDAYVISLGYNSEVEISCLNKLGWIQVLQGHLNEAIPLLEKAIARARQNSNYYQLTESLVDLADVRGRLKDHEESQLLMQEAVAIAKKYHYYYLLGIAESSLAEIYYANADYPQTFAHFGTCCYYMSLYNPVEHDRAVRKTISSLLAIPVQHISSIAESLRLYWESVDLDEKDTFFQALDEVMVLMDIP